MIRPTFLALMALCQAACASLPAAGSPADPQEAITAARPVGSGLSADDRDPLAAVTLPALPDWTDRYADSTRNGDVRYFNISALMARHHLTRWQAVELQNHYRDLSRAHAAGGPTAWYAQALRRVQAHDYESGYDAEALAAAPFIVVFDLDATLYDQHLRHPEGCHDLEAPQPSGKLRPILRVPGWAEAFARIRELGGAIVIFSANLDDPTRANLRAWTWRGAPLLGHPDIAAIMTNSYLVRQSKREGAGADNPRHGHPVILASKDLRLFDERLERVIIVDNNPLRIFHHANTRRFPEFQGDAYCAAQGPLRAAYDAALPSVVRELEDAVSWQRAHGGTFAAAYRPFTMLGVDEVRALSATGLSEEDAISFVRQHPEIVRDGY